MTKLTELDKDGVLPKKKKPIEDIRSSDKSWPYCPSCNKSETFCKCIGFNDCVSQNDRLELVVDEDRIAAILSDVRYECLGKPGMTQGKLSELSANKLKSTLPQWAKIGIKQ